MKRKIILKEKYSKTLLPFSRNPQYGFEPKISVVLKSPIDAHITPFAHKFLLDTGASISIIGPQYHSFIKHLMQKDELPIQFGIGRPTSLPIYDIIFIIQGKEIKSTVAYNKDSNLLLLGHHNFFENFSYNLFDSITKESRLY